MKERVTKAYKETSGATLTVAKIALIAIPAGIAVKLDVDEMTSRQLLAVASALVAFGFGFIFLQRR